MSWFSKKPTAENVTVRYSTAVSGFTGDARPIKKRVHITRTGKDSPLRDHERILKPNETGTFNIDGKPATITNRGDGTVDIDVKGGRKYRGPNIL